MSSSRASGATVAATGAAGACAWWHVVSKMKGVYHDLKSRLQTESRRAEDDLMAHFVSVQRICDRTALPAVVPRLKYVLQRRLDLSAQLHVLRAPAAVADTVSSQHKLHAWEELKVLAFTRVAASTLSLAVLSLHMRIMLNILSRQLYLEHALQGTPGRAGWSSLTVASQESFLSLVEKGFPSVGVGGLIRVVRRAVSGRVADLQLSKSLSATELQTLLENIRRDVLPAVLRGDWMIDENGDDDDSGVQAAGGCNGVDRDEHFFTLASTGDQGAVTEARRPLESRSWEDVLLPPDNLVPQALANRAGAVDALIGADGGDGAVIGSEGWGSATARGDFETEQLVCMVREVRATVRNSRFVDTLEASLNGAWAEMTAETARTMYGDDPERTMAVAKLVPAMSNLSGEFLDEPGALLSAVAQCREVHAFTREIW